MMYLSWCAVLYLAVGILTIAVGIGFGYMLRKANSDLTVTPPHFKAVKYTFQVLAIIMILLNIIKFL